jgi:hypothetical protein
MSVSANACPRNHLYRTPVRLPPKTLRARGEPHHVSDLAHELDGEAVIGRAHHYLLDEPAQNLQRLGLGDRVGERVLQVGDLLPIDLGKIGMEPRRCRWCAGDVRLERGLTEVKHLESRTC